jgi:hypothetical protein
MLSSLNYTLGTNRSNRLAQREKHIETQPLAKDHPSLLTHDQQATSLEGQVEILTRTKPWNNDPRPVLWRRWKRWFARPAMRPKKTLRKKLSKRLRSIAQDPGVETDRREAAKHLLAKVEVMGTETLHNILSTVQSAIDSESQRQASLLGEPPRNHRICHTIIIDRPTENPKDTSSEKHGIILDEAYQNGWVMVSLKTLNSLGVGFTPLETVTAKFQGGMDDDPEYTAIGVANKFRFRIEGVPNDGMTFESAPHPSRSDGLPEEGTVPFYVYKENPRRAPFMFGDRAIAHLRLRQLPNFSTGTHTVVAIEASKHAAAAEAGQDKAGKSEDEKARKKAEMEKERRKREHDARKSQNASAS